MKKLNYKKMCEDIDALVNTDACFDMEAKLVLDGQPYTQEEIRFMAELLARVYSISHCISCKSCQTKYLLK